MQANKVTIEELRKGFREEFRKDVSTEDIQKVFDFFEILYQLNKQNESSKK